MQRRLSRFEIKKIEGFLNRYLESIVEYLQSTGNQLPSAQQATFIQLLYQIKNIRHDEDADKLKNEIKQFISSEKKLAPITDELNHLADVYYPARNTRGFNKQLKELIDKKAPSSLSKEGLFSKIKKRLSLEAVSSTKNSINEKPAEPVTIEKKCRIGMIGDSFETMQQLLAQYARMKSGVEQREGSTKSVLTLTEMIATLSCQVEIHGPLRIRNPTARNIYDNRKSTVVLLCINLFEPDGFDHAEKWLAEHDRYSVNDAPIIVVGCHQVQGQEIVRAVDEKSVREFCRSHHLGYAEIDLVTGVGVKNLFNMAMTLAAHVLAPDRVSAAMLVRPLPNFSHALKRAHLAASPAYKLGAVHGLLRHHGVGRDVASVIAQHISPEDAANTAASSKSAYESAKVESDKNKRKKPSSK